MYAYFDSNVKRAGKVYIIMFWMWFGDKDMAFRLYGVASRKFRMCISTPYMEASYLWEHTQ